MKLEDTFEWNGMLICERIEQSGKDLVRLWNVRVRIEI